MEEKNKDSLRGGVKPGQVGAEQQSRADLNAREYKYVLHISHDELAYLNQYRQVIAAGTARFAEVHYNYLFDNPDIADLLYADERDGRDVSETIRAELAFMLDMFSVHEEGKREAGLIRAGEQRFARGIKPVWVTGAYLMFMEFLRDLMAEEGIAFADRERRVRRVRPRIPVRGSVRSVLWRDCPRWFLAAWCGRCRRLDPLVTGAWRMAAACSPRLVVDLAAAPVSERRRA